MKTRIKYQGGNDNEQKKMVLAGMLLMAATSFAQAKYIFYFIGDGMGAAQRQITEEYKKE